MFTFLLTVPLNTGSKCVGYLMFTVIQMINQRIFPGHASQIGTVTMLSQLSYSKHWVKKEHLLVNAAQIPSQNFHLPPPLALVGSGHVKGKLSAHVQKAPVYYYKP